MVAENLPRQEQHQAKRAKSDSASVGCFEFGRVELLREPAPEEISPAGLQPAEQDGEIGTKKRSNCSRERCAGKISASLASNKAELPRAFGQFIQFELSSRSLSSRRIWNQLTAATSKPTARK